MRILILDDEQCRHDAVDAFYVGHSVNPEGARAMVMNLTRRNVKVTWRPYTAISFEKG